MEPNQLTLGDMVMQKQRGKGVVLGVTKRTLTIKFPASTVKYSFTGKCKLIELDGTIKVN